MGKADTIGGCFVRFVLSRTASPSRLIPPIQNWIVSLQSPSRKDFQLFWPPTSNSGHYLSLVSYHLLPILSLPTLSEWATTRMNNNVNEVKGCETLCYIFYCNNYCKLSILHSRFSELNVFVWCSDHNSDLITFAGEEVHKTRIVQNRSQWLAQR